MAPITNLYTAYKHPFGKTDMPIVVLMHSWLGSATDFTTTPQRIAALGFLVIVPGMRGCNSAGGTADASAREIFDIYDAVISARTRFAGIVSTDKAAIVGYSGGGGNVFAAISKFPDFWNVAVAHFGISDYGRDGTNGWYQNNGGGYAAGIATRVGGIPGDVPDNYYARDATAAAANYSGGHLYMYHDKQDTINPYVHSNRIKTAFDGAGLSNYSANFSDTGDAVRWTHGYPDTVPDSITAEPTWSSKILSQAAWTIPASGTITVIGYIKTKRFTIWLNSGLDAAATVVYDTVAGTYTVTPLTSNAVVSVSIAQGALTASGNTDGETLFTVM